jgi:hypothetical protein
MARPTDVKQYGGTPQKQAGPLGNPPTADEVDSFHTNSDVDLRAEALHHTLGGTGNQAAKGDHRHDGSDSVLLLDGITIVGNTPETVINSMMTALVRLGAKDSTSL